MPEVNALHLTLNDFQNASRVLKETRSLTSAGLFDHIYISALHKSELAEQESISDHITLHRLILRSRRLKGSFVAYALMYLEYAIAVGRLFRSKQIRCVNAHSLAVLPMAWILARWWSAKLVYDAHELETETDSLIWDRLPKRVSRWMERTLILRCDLVLVVGESIADWYADTYQIDRPAVVFNAPAVQHYPDSNLLREQLKLLPTQRILLYQGLLSTGRGVEALLDHFSQRQTTDLVMVFMGYGPLWEQVQQASENCSLIRGVPAVPPDVVLQYTASADYGIAFGDKSCLSYDLSMPNKLFEYLMAGLPVIVSPLKEMSNFVKENACGVVAEDFDADSLEQAITQILGLDREILSSAAREVALSNAWQTQAEKMVHAYQKSNIGK